MQSSGLLIRVDLALRKLSDTDIPDASAFGIATVELCPDEAPELLDVVAVTIELCPDEAPELVDVVVVDALEL